MAEEKKSYFEHLVAGFALLLAACTLCAQEAPPKLFPKPETQGDVLVLKKNVRRVVVDVVVRDSTGKPVHGLAAKDFAVSEDGQRQKVLSFEIHNLDEPSIAMPADAPATLPANVFVNVPKAPERGPLYVILFDMVNTDEVSDQAAARQQVLKFIRSKPEGSRFAVFVHSDGLHLLQGFTADKDLLYATFDPSTSKPHFPKMFLLYRNYGRGDPVAMISVMTHIAEFLDGIPGRKNLIWMSGTFPMDFYPRQGDSLDLREDMRGMVNALTRAQVAVYPINVRGVVVNPEGALTGGRSAKSGVGGEAAGGGMSTSGSVSGGATTSGPMPSTVPTTSRTPNIQDGIGPLQYESGSGSLLADYSTQNDIAAATGGRAFYSDNDLNAALGEAVQDGASYYTLSYSPTNPNYDGSLRKIGIALAERGYHLAYRRSYYADDPDAPRTLAKKNASEEAVEELATKEQERSVYANLQHGAPLVHQLIFKARIYVTGPPAMATPAQMAELSTQPAYARGNKKGALRPVQIQTYSVYYVVVGSQIKPQQNEAIPLEFAAVAYDSEGRVVNGIDEKAIDQSTQKVYRAMQQLDVPVGATSIRVVVRDTSTDRVGAMEIPLPLSHEPQTPPRSRPAGSAGTN